MPDNNIESLETLCKHTRETILNSMIINISPRYLPNNYVYISFKFMSSNIGPATHKYFILKSVTKSNNSLKYQERHSYIKCCSECKKGFLISIILLLLYNIMYCEI